METTTLQVQSRKVDAKAKDLLKENLIPAEYYGKGVENVSLQMDYQTFRKIYKTAGTNTVLKLDLDGGKAQYDALIYEVQYDPIRDTVTHVDFINVRMDQEIYAKIPLEFFGTALAVKDLGGTLTPHMNEIEVKCLPKDLVKSIQVSIEPLQTFHDFIRIKDLNIPQGIIAKHDPEDVVIVVAPPKQEEEASQPAEGDTVVEGEAAEGASAEGASADQKSSDKEGDKGEK